MSASIPQTTVDLSKYIEIRDGRPNIRGRRLQVAFLAMNQRYQQRSIAELADSFTLSEEQVLAALLYYREHQAEIDAQYEADAKESDKLHQEYGGRMPGQS
ncbi:MAG: DUF433 domain-containing protein [Anaerolineae bacterium]|nr:DUF433 domain-containing protein [Anaerolineae bacterium]